MPNQKRRRSNPKSRGNTRRRRTNSAHKYFTSDKILTLTLKSRHNNVEVYPLDLAQLIDRANTGQDADIRLLSYTFQVTVATGNALETVTMNLGHSGPWVRRGQSANDTFNQQSREHNFARSKSILFKVSASPSEREFLNPDTTTPEKNYINLRVQDSCGVIPGATLRIECRARLARKMPTCIIADASSQALDRYEDQDVSSGSTIVPPTAVQDVPKLIYIESNTATKADVYTTSDTKSPFVFSTSRLHQTLTITAAGKTNIVGAFYTRNALTSQNLHDIQSSYDRAGFSGTLSM